MLKLSDNLAVGVYDAKQWAVYVRYTDKHGKDSWRAVSYCTTLKALSRVAQEYFVEQAVRPVAADARDYYSKHLVDKLHDMPSYKN